MAPSVPRPPRPDDPAGSPGAPSWEADEAQAAPASADTAQMPLFQFDAKPTRRARLRRRIQALLTTRSRRRARPAEAARPANSSWPDSFFDGQGIA